MKLYDNVMGHYAKLINCAEGHCDGNDKERLTERTNERTLKERRTKAEGKTKADEARSLCNASDEL